MGLLRAVSRSLSCFVYISLFMSIFVLAIFIFMDKSPGRSDGPFYDGPDAPSFKLVGSREVRNLRNSNRETKTLPPTNALNQDNERILAAVKGFDCVKLFSADEPEFTKASKFLETHNYTFPLSDKERVLSLTRDCDNLQNNVFALRSSPEEEEFPLAFTIIFHKNVDQLERLLRAIYRPQNAYCIHIDRKTPIEVQYVVERLVSCFDNIFIASRLEVVIYKSYTRLKADINCMTDLVQREGPWKYLLNIASSEFPIRTNAELVKVLKVFNGSNDIHEVMATRNLDRFKEKHFTYIDEKARTGYIIHSKKPKEDPPHGLVITKGNAYNVFSRQFVKFVLTDNVAGDLLSWSADTLTPDEHYWATLNNLYSNPKLETPGGFKGHPDKKPFVARYIGWNNNRLVDRCKSGRYVHNVCVFTVADLPMIRSRHELIANKFDTEFDPIAYRCMEEMIRNRTLDNPTAENFELKPYQRLPFVKKGN